MQRFFEIMYECLDTRRLNLHQSQTNCNLTNPQNPANHGRLRASVCFFAAPLAQTLAHHIVSQDLPLCLFGH